jgi:hypothetical protein
MFKKYEIAFLYGVSVITFNKMLQRVDIDHTPRLFSPKTVEEIFEKLGYPVGWEIVRYENGGIKFFKDIR